VAAVSDKLRAILQNKSC